MRLRSVDAACRAVVVSLSLLCRVSTAQAGESKQETAVEFPGVRVASVSSWVAEHADDLEAAAGAKVLAHNGDYVKLQRPDDKPGMPDCLWIAKRTQEGGEFADTLVRRLAGAMDDGVTRLSVQKTAAGCRVVITIEASVEGRAAAKVAIGARRALRGIRARLEEEFPKPPAARDPR
jgi:hypothetical protein